MGSFSIRTTRPNGQKEYITKSAGGWSSCIQGKPTYGPANTLANCVGYACGRFNEVYNLITGHTGNKYASLNCNAENFIERAISLGLKIVSEPVVGGIMVWQKGATLSGSDGAGHVAFVEKKNSATQVYTSESGWGSSSIFWNSTRNKGNGNWGAGSGYKYRGCIVNPAVGEDPTPGPQPTPGGDSKFKIGDEVIINGPLYVSSTASSPAGYVTNKKTKITRVAKGTSNPYNTAGDLGWMREESITAITPTPQPTPTTERKGLDISSYQSGISFDAIKNSEYSNFIILRGGFTGWGTGVNYNKDNCFEGFYSSAKSKGIPVGCYWYSCANTYEKGVAEANFLYENCLKGKQFEYPIYMDVEDSHWQEGNKDGVTAAIKGFCETLEAKKYYVGIYGSDISGFQEKIHLDQLGAYDKWVARYGSSPKYVTSYGMWQTSSSGRIVGYGDNLDTDIAYKDYEKIIKEAKLNGYGDEPQPTPPEPTPEPPKPTYKYNIGDRVVINGRLYGDSNGGNPGITVSNKVTNITRRADGAKYPYNTTGDLGWMAEESISPYTEPPKPTYNVGDTVIVNGYLTATAAGTGSKTKNYNNQKGKIIMIRSNYARPYALNMNNNMNGVTGWGSQSQISK